MDNDNPRHRILLIDTDSNYLSRLFDVLAMGYEVVVRNDTVSTLNKLHIIQPDLVVLETKLPEIDGFEFARLLRRRVEHRTVPVVFLAKRVSEPDRRMAGMVGAMNCLEKSVPLGHLAADISRLIQNTPIPARRKAYSLQEIYDIQHDEAVRDKMRPRQPIVHPRKDAMPPDLDAPPTARELDAPQASHRVEPAKTKPSPPALDDLMPMGPASPPRPNPAPGSAPPTETPRARVLIAHPEASRLAELCDELFDTCDCIGATSGLEAVDKAGRYRPDILLVNMRMPGMQGFEVSQMLRSEGHFSEMPIMGMVDEGDSLKSNDMWRYGITQLFTMPGERDKMIVEVVAASQAPGFLDHGYPQTFAEVLAQEEDHRRKVEQMLAKRHKLEEDTVFHRFFSEAREDESPPRRGRHSST